MNDIKSFVLLKYQVLTTDPSTWYLCETYPLEVRKNWAWRCAEDIEHLDTRKNEKEIYRVARLYRDGKATREEVNITKTANYAVYVATLATDVTYATSAADYAADYASYLICAISPTSKNAIYAAKWNLYIKWLIEELCKYEGLQIE